MAISDIAFIIGVDVDNLCDEIANQFSDAAKHYMKGKTASKLKLRAQEMQLAQVGSPLALVNVHKNLLDMEDDE